MAKALFGTTTDPRTLSLLEEVRTLRKRVAELEAALDRAERALREDEHVVDLEPDDLATFDRSSSVPA